MTGGTPFTPVRQARASGEIVSQIERKIFDGDLVTGNRLESERELAERFGVSRITVRDALRVLEFRGDTDAFLDHGHGRASLNLERLVPCVEGGSVIEKVDPEQVKAEIKVKMGAMSLKFKGTVAVVEQDQEAHRAVMRVKSKEAGGQGHANADVTFSLSDGGGTIHTAAQITGKAASMGEGVVTSVLDALIKDFTEKLANI